MRTLLGRGDETVTMDLYDLSRPERIAYRGKQIAALGKAIGEATLTRAEAELLAALVCALADENRGDRMLIAYEAEKAGRQAKTSDPFRCDRCGNEGQIDGYCADCRADRDAQEAAAAEVA
jgi:hypothetical protein